MDARGVLYPCFAAVCQFTNRGVGRNYFLLVDIMEVHHDRATDFAVAEDGLTAETGTTIKLFLCWEIRRRTVICLPRITHPKYFAARLREKVLLSRTIFLGNGGPIRNLGRLSL